jgi:hypothetical protein
MNKTRITALASVVLALGAFAVTAQAADQPATSPTVKAAVKPPPFASPGPFPDTQESKAAAKKSAGKTDVAAKKPPPNFGTGLSNPPPPQAEKSPAKQSKADKFGWDLRTTETR